MSGSAPAGEALVRPAPSPEPSVPSYGTAAAAAGPSRGGSRGGSRDEPHTERWTRPGSREEPAGERRGSRPSSRDDPAGGERSAGDDNLSFRKFSRSVRLANTLAHAAGSHPAEGSDGAAAASGAAAEPSEPPQPQRTWYDISCDRDGIKELVAENTYLLLFLVASSALAFCAIRLAWGAVAVFSLCFVALVPLAVLLGDLTEALSGWCGAVLGGLLNATLGNATEAIVLVQALRHRLVGVEQAALLGGVLSNTLLVLGLSFIAGGLATGGSQYFDRRVAAADVGVLLVSVVAVRAERYGYSIAACSMHLRLRFPIRSLCRWCCRPSPLRRRAARCATRWVTRASPPSCCWPCTWPSWSTRSRLRPSRQRATWRRRRCCPM